MLLKYLINNIAKKKKNIEIEGITLDSRKVRKGYIFFALRGQKTNGEKCPRCWKILETKCSRCAEFL